MIQVIIAIIGTLAVLELLSLHGRVTALEAANRAALELAQAQKTLNDVLCATVNEVMKNTAEIAEKTSATNLVRLRHGN